MGVGYFIAGSDTFSVICDVCAERPPLRQSSAPLAFHIAIARDPGTMTTTTHKWITCFTTLRVDRPVHAPAVTALPAAPDALDVIMTQVHV
mmetsp:Transcript_49922/g.99077  ORF Transcript_49922/g.99077 Transcript_49922/m.99077 type:complete len:91 (-) Transcript_49922:153-425(-)